MISPAFVTGWVCVALLASAASVPLTYRVLEHRRAPPDSRPIGGHVVLGLATTAAALAHAIAMLPSLGSPGAVAGGMLALAPGALAFFLLAAHVGLGTQLRSPRLRNRAKKRRQHLIVATCIAAAVTAHVIAIRDAGKPGAKIHAGTAVGTPSRPLARDLRLARAPGAPMLASF